MKRTQFPLDLIPEGWVAVADVAPSSFDVARMKPRLILGDGEMPICSEELHKRAVECRGNRSLDDGRRMLAEQDKIPAEFRDFYIPLPGTVMWDASGDLRVAYLDYSGVRWRLGFHWFVVEYGARGRFACVE